MTCNVVCVCHGYTKCAYLQTITVLIIYVMILLMDVKTVLIYSLSMMLIMMIFFGERKMQPARGRFA